MKIAKIAILVLIILIVAGFFIAHHVLPDTITRLIRQEIHQALEGKDTSYYNIHVSKVSFSAFFTQMHVPDIRITPNENAWLDLEENQMPQRILEITSGQIRISTNGLIDLYREREAIEFSEIRFDSISAFVYDNPGGKQPEKTVSSYQPTTIRFNNIHLRHIDIENRLLADTSQMNWSVGHAHFTGNIEVNFVEDTIQTPVIHVSEPSFALHRIGFYENDLYLFSLDSIQYTPDAISIHNFQMNPRYDKARFSRHLTFQTERMMVHIPYAVINNLDVNEIFNSDVFMSPGITIEKPEIHAFRDRNVPHDNTRYRQLFTRLIRGAPLQLHINEINISDAVIYYSELPEGGDTEGMVSFENLQATVTNITNMSHKLQEDSIMRISAQALSFGKSILQADFMYNLKDLNGGFHVRGRLKELDFQAINPILSPLAGVEIKAGTHLSSEFVFSGNDKRSSGSLTMLYSDLNIILEPERSELRQRIVGWAGRNFLYYPANPIKQQEPRTVEIYFERDTSRFIFHYWWQSYLSGIINTVRRN